MRLRLIILYFLVLPFGLHSQSRLEKSKCWGKLGIALNAGGYLFNFNEAHNIPFFFGQPFNHVIVFPAPDILIGNEDKYYMSIGYSYDINNFITEGTTYGLYLNHPVKSYSATNQWYFKICKTLFKRKKSRYAANLGLNFARTFLQSGDVEYYTWPNDTVQYFFLGKFKQDFIVDFSMSAYFNFKEKSSIAASVGFSVGYNLGVFKGKIIQKQGEPLVNPPIINYSGPYIKITMLQFWTKRKTNSDGMQ